MPTIEPAKKSTMVMPKRTPAGAEDRIAGHDKRRRARAEIASITADPTHNRQNASSSAGTFAILTMTFDRAQATTATPTAPTPRRVARRPRGLVVSIVRLSQPRGCRLRAVNEGQPTRGLGGSDPRGRGRGRHRSP